MKTTQDIRKIITPICSPSYEQKRRGLIGWLQMRTIKLLAQLPPKIAQTVFLAFSGRNDDTRVVFNNVTTWKALEVMYTYQERRMKEKVGFGSRFWENFLDNARSIRNRLTLAKEELSQAIRKIDNDRELVHIVSIGSGSARSVLETIEFFNGKSPQIKALLIDSDQTAIEFSRRLARELDINGYTTRLTGNFFRLERDAAEFNPDVIELVGLLDYLTDKQAIVLLGKAYRILTIKGYLITGNIAPNIEAPFVTKGINWPMIYRTPEELQALLIEAGFSAKNVRLEQEPLGVHMVAIAQKLPNP